MGRTGRMIPKATTEFRKIQRKISLISYSLNGLHWMLQETVTGTNRVKSTDKMEPWRIDPRAKQQRSYQRRNILMKTR